MRVIFRACVCVAIVMMASRPETRTLYLDLQFKMPRHGHRQITLRKVRPDLMVFGQRGGVNNGVCG